MPSTRPYFMDTLIEDLKMEGLYNEFLRRGHDGVFFFVEDDGLRVHVDEEGKERILGRNRTLFHEPGFAVFWGEVPECNTVMNFTVIPMEEGRYPTPDGGSTDSVSNAEVYARGTIRVDGCADWRFGNDEGGYIHFCNPAQAMRLGAMLYALDVWVNDAMETQYDEEWNEVKPESLEAAMLSLYADYQKERSERIEAYKAGQDRKRAALKEMQNAQH